MPQNYYYFHGVLGTHNKNIIFYSFIRLLDTLVTNSPRMEKMTPSSSRYRWSIAGSGQYHPSSRVLRVEGSGLVLDMPTDSFHIKESNNPFLESRFSNEGAGFYSFHFYYYILYLIILSKWFCLHIHFQSVTFILILYSCPIKMLVILYIF